MKILLINPWIYDFTAFDLWAKPLGILHIADMLQKEGHNITLIDTMDRNIPEINKENRKYGTGKYISETIDKPKHAAGIKRFYKRYGMTQDKFKERLNTEKPDIILITSHMTYWYQGVSDVLDILRRKFPKTPVILGGIYASIMTEHARKHMKNIVIFKGTKMNKLIKLLNNLLTGTIKNTYSLTELIPDYSLYKNLSYASTVTSFGCPYNCSYCASKNIHGNFSEKPISILLREFDYYIYKRKIQNIALFDDALLVNKENRLIPILKEIIKRYKNINLHTPNGLHINEISEELAVLMKESGFKTVRLSFESHTNNIAKKSSGKTSIQSFKHAVRNLLNAGFKANELDAYIMTNLPGQKEQDIEETIKIVTDMGLTPKKAEFSPIPGTKEFNEARKIFPEIAHNPILHNPKVYAFLTTKQKF